MQVGGPGLSTPELQRLSGEPLAAVGELISLGRGKMPGFGAECAPRGACTFGPRLSQPEIAALAQFVLDQAARGWPPQ